ncbi:MAG: PAAR domain-containing protein [Halobacteria archaeon]
MAEKPCARLTDTVACTCMPCPPGVVITAAKRSLCEDLPIARITDLCSNCCPCPCPNAIVEGKPRTITEDLPTAFLGSQVVCGVITSGAKRTLVGY